MADVFSTSRLGGVMQSVLSNPLVIAAFAALVIARQFLPRPVRAGSLVVVPLVAGVLGLQALASSPPAGALAVGLLVANLLVGAAMGVVRAVTVRLWRDASGTWMMQGTLLTFVCWLLSIAVKVGLGVAGHGFPTNEIALFVAVTFGAQYLVVWLRMNGMAPVPTYDRAG